MKFFTALFVALVAVHASTQSPLQDTNIQKIVVDVLNKVLAETQVLLDHVNAWADQLDSNKDNYEKVTVEALTKVGLKINGGIMTLVEKLKTDASDNSKTIIDCVEAEKAKVDALIGAVFQQIADCEFENYEDFSALAKTVLKQLTELQANFKILTSNLSECEGGDVLCLTIFLGGVVEQADDVVTNAKADIGQLKGLLSGMKHSAEQCHIIEAIHKDSTEVIDEVATCIYK